MQINIPNLGCWGGQILVVSGDEEAIFARVGRHERPVVNSNARVPQPGRSWDVLQISILVVNVRLFLAKHRVTQRISRLRENSRHSARILFKTNMCTILLYIPSVVHLKFKWTRAIIIV